MKFFFEIKKIRSSIKSIIRHWDDRYQPLSKDHIDKILLPSESEELPSIDTNNRSASFSWLDYNGKNYVSGVKNQGLCNSCGAFSVIAALETMLGYSTKEESLLSEGQLLFINPWYSPRFLPGRHNCFQGLKIQPALDYLITTGALPSEDYPYDLKKKFFPLPGDWVHRTTTISGYEKLETSEEMKNWLAEKGPLVTSVPFRVGLILYKEGVYTSPSGSLLGEHGLCIVGYDDQKQAWLCKNSWGRGWGIEGFGWLAYDTCGLEKNTFGITGLNHVYKRGEISEVGIR